MKVDTQCLPAVDWQWRWHETLVLGSGVMECRSWGGDRSRWGWRGGEISASAPAAASRLERALRRLAELASSSAEDPAAVEHAGPVGAVLHCTQNPPAVPDAIAEAELRLGTALPADYVQFLLSSDGALLREGSGLAAELLGTAALVRHAEEMEYAYRARCIPDLVIFATVGGEGDRLAFETGRMNPCRSCGVLDARRDYRPDQWWVIARDFTAWLDQILYSDASHSSFGRHWDQALSVLQPALPLQDPE